MEENITMMGSEIECPRCGTQVYYGLNRCPNCGLSFYPNEAEEPPEEVLQPQEGVNGVLATIIGWIAAGIIYFAVDWITGSVTSGTSNMDTRQLVLFVGGLAAVLAGSLLANALGKSTSLAYGLAVGVLTTGVAFLLEARWHVMNLATILQPVVFLKWFVMILGGVTGSFIYGNYLVRLPAKGFLPIQNESDLYQELLKKVRFDHSAADRLIEYERQQHPHASSMELVRTAIWHWEKDNRYPQGG